MENKNYLQIAGMLVCAIILSSGGTLYLKDLGTKTSCKTGFQYIDSGQYEGYYACYTSTGARYELCYEVYNSANTENYWCMKAEIIKIESRQEHDNKNEGFITEWICPQNKECERK